ncbi:MAG: sporadic carbohydrate cluster 2OG-Fe(II) oxygenase [Bacteriovoracaceae bacterium]|jgi:sporadic carbohydrate cluster 2OG-Fe(II) oxygenase
MSESFYSEDEKIVIESFLENGYHIFDLENLGLLDEIKEQILGWSKVELGLGDISVDEFFDNTSAYVAPDKLNSLRVHIIDKLSRDEKIKKSIYLLSKKNLEIIVGNELCMQRAINLSIQMPNDDSSVLPLHTDVWSGNSPYEVVFWLPLVNCFKTKSMYLLPYKDSMKVISDFRKYKDLNAEELYLSLKEQLVWLNVPFGKGVIFSHSILHGNRINEEKETRWTFNTRFKSMLSPYGNKGLGESFIPINIRPATRVGFNYSSPDIWD